jgi:muconate cycloisomerase
LPQGFDCSGNLGALVKFSPFQQDSTMPAIARVEIRHVRLNLKKKIKHASHVRASSDSLMVEVHLDSGEIGYGEGVPREYVTGETIDSAFEIASKWQHPEILESISSLTDIVTRLCEWAPAPPPGDDRKIGVNAARCAVEIAMLDACCQYFGVSLSETIPLVPFASQLQHGPSLPVRYSGAITAETPMKERISATKMWIWGFRQVKVKVGVTGQDDAARLKRIRRRLGRRCEIRLDANEAWSPAEFKGWAEKLSFSQPSAYEQPVPHEQIHLLANPEYHVPVPVILDESLCGPVDAENAIRGGFGEIFNIRLSKCGGLLPSLRLVAMATQAGRRYGLGCHPGESPILSAAGRAFASRVRNLAFIEGSYDRHVLTDRFTTPDITFGYGGLAQPIDRPGLGIEINREKLDAMTVNRHTLRYN